MVPSRTYVPDEEGRVIRIVIEVDPPALTFTGSEGVVDTNANDVVIAVMLWRTFAEFVTVKLKAILVPVV